jgi:hypothetical protein
MELQDLARLCNEALYFRQKHRLPNSESCHTLESEATAGPGCKKCAISSKAFMSSRLESGWERESPGFAVCRYISFLHLFEFTIIFIGLPNIFGGVTVNGLPASE